MVNRTVMRAWIKSWERRWRRILGNPASEGLKIEKEEENKYCSGYIKIPFPKLDRIIYRSLKGACYGEILFGFKPENSENLRYDVLIVDLTECGVIPKEFVPFGGSRIELYSLLDLEKDNPYEEIFRKLEEHFTEKRDCPLNSNYLSYLYYSFKNFMVKKGAKEDLVFFVEKRKGIPYRNI